MSALAPGRAVGRTFRTGQAMVETVIALLFLLFAFLAAFQYADNLRTKILLKYAAFRCARARAVGYDDFKLLKTLRLATISAAGEALAKDDSGNPLSTGGTLGRMGTYLSSMNHGAARCVLDYAYWEDGRTPMPQVVLSGRRLETDVLQRRPQFFDVFSYFSGGQAVHDASGGGDGAPELELHGRAAVEAHYPDYLQ